MRSEAEHSKADIGCFACKIRRSRMAASDPTPGRETTQAVTRLLLQWTEGDAKALDQLLPLVYDELRRLAQSYLRRENVGHTLQSTALVHEAYLRLVDQRDVNWQNRSHFFGIAAQMMRRVLVDHARAHHA